MEHTSVTDKANYLERPDRSPFSRRGHVRVAHRAMIAACADARAKSLRPAFEHRSEPGIRCSITRLMAARASRSRGGDARRAPWQHSAVIAAAEHRQGCHRPRFERPARGNRGVRASAHRSSAVGAPLAVDEVPPVLGAEDRSPTVAVVGLPEVVPASPAVAAVDAAGLAGRVRITVIVNTRIGHRAHPRRAGPERRAHGARFGGWSGRGGADGWVWVWTGLLAAGWSL